MEENYMEVLLEDIRSKFDLVLEGHEALHGEIRDLNRKTEERFDMVDFKIGVVNQKIDAVDQKLSAKIDAVDQKLSAKIDAVEQNLSARIDAVAADLKAHRHDTEAHGRGYLVSE